MGDSSTTVYSKGSWWQIRGNQVAQWGPSRPQISRQKQEFYFQGQLELAVTSRKFLLYSRNMEEESWNLGGVTGAPAMRQPSPTTMQVQAEGWAQMRWWSIMISASAAEITAGWLPMEPGELDKGDPSKHKTAMATRSGSSKMKPRIQNRESQPWKWLVLGRILCGQRLISKEREPICVPTFSTCPLELQL